MKKMILSAVMLVFAASGRAQEAGAASPTEHNEWLTTFEAVAVDADLDIKFVKVPDTEAPKIVYDTKGSYTSKFRAEVKDKTLRISEKYDSRRPDRTQVTVYYNTLQSVSLSGCQRPQDGAHGRQQRDAHRQGGLLDAVRLDGQGRGLGAGGDVGRGQCPEQGRRVAVDHRPVHRQDHDQRPYYL